MPRRKTSRKTSKKKGILKKRRRKQRPYKRDKRAHKVRRRKLHHKAEFRKEQEMTNYLLNQLLKTAASTEDKPYSYHPRHHSKDPEFAYSSERLKEFKKGFPASDTHFWRPQGEHLPTSRGNFPDWEPQWEHTYQHPHAV